MEYAPRVSNPYVSRVDGGTVEAIRDLGVEIVSSGDLIQQFEATWDDDQWRMHLRSGKVHHLGLRPGLGPDRRTDQGGREDPRDSRFKRRSWTISIAMG